MISTARHTPGPWAVKSFRYTKRGVTFTRPAVIARSSHYITTEINASSMATGETDANAQLIASAPDMFAALLQAPTPLMPNESDKERMAWIDAYSQWYHVRCTAVIEAETVGRL